MIGESELKRLVAEGIRRTVNKFREHPYVFFTETDIHAYIYHLLYSKRLMAKTKDGVLTTCLHKEYPTNFRYSKETMADYGLRRKGTRGNFDLVVLNPQFIRTNDIKNVVNKDVLDVEERSKSRERFRKELIAVIEFKYVINNSKNFVTLVEKDTIKLSHGLKYQDFEAYNLVFCNLKYHYAKDLEEEIRTFEYQTGAKGKHRIRKLLVRSYFEGPIKVAPKPLTNGWKI